MTKIRLLMYTIVVANMVFATLVFRMKGILMNTTLMASSLDSKVLTAEQLCTVSGGFGIGGILNALLNNQSSPSAIGSNPAFQALFEQLLAGMQAQYN
jgi:hypothetical protein